MPGLRAEFGRDLVVVMLTAMIVGMTVTLTVPLLTINLERIGASPLTIGLNSTAAGLGIFLVGPFIDRIAARFGTVACFRVGLLVSAACALLFAVRVDPWYWFALRIAFGGAGAVMFVLNEATVNGLVSDRNRGRVLGVYATLFTLGYAGGPLLLLVAGTEGRLPFYVAAAVFALAILPTTLLGPLDERLRPEGKEAKLRLLEVARAAPLPLAAVFAYAFVEGSVFSLIPLWGMRIGLAAGAAGALIGVFLSGNIALQYPIGWLADRLPRHLVLAGCGLLGAAGMLALPLLTAAHGPLLWALLAVLGGVTGGTYAVALVLLGDRFKGADQTVANTVFVMTFQLGTVAGPPVTGAVMHWVGPATFPLVLVAPMAALAALALLRGGPVGGEPVATATSRG